MKIVRFILNGQQFELTADDVRRCLRGVQPEPIRLHGVRVDTTAYPVKQALEVATGVPRSAFISHTARRHLSALGFEIMGEIESRGKGSPGRQHGRAAETIQVLSAGDDWHTEAQIQAMVVAFLASTGWRIRSVADTAARQHGVDILADRGQETVAVEVKGFPGRRYADPTRAGERKPTQPSTQAKHWYAEAVLAAMLTRSRRPQARSVIALPMFRRYQDLYEATAGSLARSAIELWWVNKDGTVTPAAQAPT